MESKNSRRSALKKMGMGAASALALTACGTSKISAEIPATPINPIQLKGKVKHSVCRWCYGKIPFEEFCERVKEIGIGSIELTGVDEWPILQKYGLTCALGNDWDAGIPDGFNEPKNHKRLQGIISKLIDDAADFGLNQIVVFSGNRNGMSDEAGIENCAVGLDPLLKQAEKRNITLSMELLNSKVDHKDYQCDNTKWGVDLAKKIGSPNFKLLYDIYHMQIMEGDVIRTIREHKDYIGHYHTGGVPGRNEIDETQELYYPAIIQAIVDTGYTGYVAQEFIPKADDKLASLKKGVVICDV